MEGERDRVGKIKRDDFEVSLGFFGKLLLFFFRLFGMWVLADIQICVIVNIYKFFYILK